MFTLTPKGIFLRRSHKEGCRNTRQKRKQLDPHEASSNTNVTDEFQCGFKEGNQNSNQTNRLTFKLN